MTGYRIGLDVGGTFTDCACIRDDGSVVLTKSPTTRDDESRGCLEALRDLARMEGLGSLRDLLERTAVIIHGTTTADNTMITMSGPPVGLITTQGMRDVIEIRRGWKEDIWNPRLPAPPPLALRRNRFGVPERLGSKGETLVPLDEEAVRRAARLLRDRGIDSVAICFLFSFLDPTHERRAAELVLEENPAASLSLSHQIMPTSPEFERVSTTLVNAFVGPRVVAYLERLAGALSDDGYRHELLVMQCNGGIATVPAAIRRPVAVMGSGPAGGVIGAAEAARRAGVGDFIAVDMGGTSYDVCLVRGGRPELQTSWNWQHRYVIGLPMIDVHSIGAGGGSVARIRAGALQVGPESMGSDPGPACYGKGGIEATVTDAHVVLGYLDPTRFRGGAAVLDTAAAHAAIRRSVGEPLALDDREAAWAVLRIADATMVNAIRRSSSDRGIDPNGFALVAYGGNGPMHAGLQARELGISRVVVPRTSPVFSALGLLLADFVADELQSYITPAHTADPTRITALLEEMERRARDRLEAARLDAGRVRVEREMGLRYPGQTFDLTVPLPAAGPIGAAEVSAAVEHFHERHEALHTYAQRDQRPIISMLKVQAVGVAERVEPPAVHAGAGIAGARTGTRTCLLEGGAVETPIYDGARLGAGDTIEGPAIIEDRFSTVVLHPGMSAVLDATDQYLLDPGSPLTAAASAGRGGARPASPATTSTP
jgi:N-methylhydantoinase A